MFKMYLVDTGLLIRMYRPGTVEAIMQSDLSVNEGSSGRFRMPDAGSRGLRLFYYEVDREVVNFVVKMDAGKQISRWIKFEYDNIMRADDSVEHYLLFCACFADLLFLVLEIVFKKADPGLRIK